jgi:hypothetical protein
MSMDGPISRSEKFKKLHENPNHIPRLWDILIHVDPLPPGGSTKFFKLECSDELKELDKIIKVEFSGSTICLLK